MENSINAMIMGGSILLFILGLSVSIYLYSSIMRVNDSILTSSETYNRDAENFNFALGDNTANDFTRTIPGSEVANQILELAKRPKSTEISRQPYDYKFNEIKVNGKSYKADSYDLNSGTLSQDLISISKNKYTGKYDYTKNSITYTKK